MGLVRRKMLLYKVFTMGRMPLDQRSLEKFALYINQTATVGHASSTEVKRSDRYYVAQYARLVSIEQAQ